MQSKCTVISASPQVHISESPELKQSLQNSISSNLILACCLRFLQWVHRPFVIKIKFVTKKTGNYICLVTHSFLKHKGRILTFTRWDLGQKQACSEKNTVIQPPNGAIVFQRLFISLDDNSSDVLGYLNLLINSWTLHDSGSCDFPKFMDWG